MTSASPRRRLGWVLAVSAALAGAGPASAQVRLGREAEGDYRAGVMSWWEIPFRSVVRQRYDFSCGSAAVATLLTHHYGRAVTERTVFAEMWRGGDQAAIRRVGFSMLEMKTFLDRAGFPTQGLRLSLEQLAALARPAIVLIDLHGFKHFVVVKGIRGSRVLVGDSVLGLTQYDRADFERMWNNIALAIRPGDGRAPDYDLARDWGPWSISPLDQGGAGIRVATGDLTTNLPPTYQLSPEILLTVRVGTVR